MKRYIVIIASCLCVWGLSAKDATKPEDIPTYYQSLDSKRAEALFEEVHTVANVGFVSLGYKGLWAAYKTTDCYPEGHPLAGKIWDMYGECDNFTYGTKQCGNYQKECDCYNREHSIPKSWFGGTESGIGCDIFHLVPTDGKVNGMRSNYAFGEVGDNPTYTYNGNKLGTSNFPGYSNKVFEPIDEYKGDFARGYFGTIVKWENKNMTGDDGRVMFTNNYTSAGGYGLTPYSIALLMKWHREDPVSQKEIDRNNGIQMTQGNRNPFIDYPYLAEYFWGVKKGETLYLEELMSAYDEDFIPGESDGHRDKTPTDIFRTVDDTAVPDGYTGVYTISGQYVTSIEERNIEFIYTLPHGLYIVGGKKIIVK